MTSLTKKEAYLAMCSFLEHVYQLTKSEELDALLGGMSFLQDGGTADPAPWGDWENAIDRVKAEKVHAFLGLNEYD